VRSKLTVELRDDILDQVNKLYYERLRVKSELDSLAIEDKHKRFQKQLKIEELTASLDSLTAGFYSDQLRKMQG
jgi:predicted  nucleic acid-binding Zn-ribbon protein